MDITPTINSVHGRIRSIIGTDPAAGAQISEIIPARRRWRLHLIRTVLVTDATVVDRILKLLIDDGTNTLWQLVCATVQTASTTQSAQFSNQPLEQYAIATTIYLPLPPLILPAASRIMTATSNLQAGDNYGAPRFLIEEWIDP